MVLILTILKLELDLSSGKKIRGHEKTARDALGGKGSRIDL